MFDHFTFGAQSQPRDTLLDDAYPSPTDTSVSSPLTPPTTSFPFTHPNHAGVNDLVAKLSQQSLQQQSREQLVRQFQAWQNETSAELVVDEDNTPSETTEATSLPSTPTFVSASYRRLQRQLNVQLQSCEGHVKDINGLVEAMISSNSQCRIASQAYPSPRRADVMFADLTPESDGVTMESDDNVDEGFCEGENMDEQDMEMSLRRASAPGRIRKYNGRYGGVDSVSVGGRIKVRSLPRMRKRRVQPRAQPRVKD